MSEQKHTDECLAYAAKTGRAHCIVECRDGYLARHEHKFELLEPGSTHSVFYCDGCDRYMYVAVALRLINTHADENNTWWRMRGSN